MNIEDMNLEKKKGYTHVCIYPSLNFIIYIIYENICDVYVHACVYLTNDTHVIMYFIYR